MAAGSSDRVQVQCGCGAKLAFPAAAAGRKARCPKCRQVVELTAPGSDAPTVIAPPVATPSPAPSPDPRPSPTRIKLHCGCGAKLSVSAAVAGRKAKCPKCSRVLAVPLAAADEPSTGPGPASTPGAADFDLALQGLSTGETIAVSAAPPVREPASRPADDFELCDFAPLAPRARFTPLQEELDTGPPKTCPVCHKQLPGSAKICVDCGIDLRTRRALLTTQEDNLDQTYVYASAAVWWVSWPCPLGVYPFASEAFGLRKPWVTHAIAILTVLVSAWFLAAYAWRSERPKSLGNLKLWCGDRAALFSHRLPQLRDELRGQGASDEDIDQALETLTADLGEFHAHQLLTHALLHEGLLHLASNMLFLLVLGSRVNALVGNTLTLALYPTLAVAAGAVYALASAHDALRAMLGASGAIMGLAGMYLVLFPVHKVHVAAWLRPWPIALMVWWIPALLILFIQRRMKLFAVRGFWIVLFYIAFDVYSVVTSADTGVAYWAHLGGFISGVTLALALLFARVINARGGDVLTAVLGPRAWKLIGHPNRPGLRLW